MILSGVIIKRLSTHHDNGVYTQFEVFKILLYTFYIEYHTIGFPLDLIIRDSLSMKIESYVLAKKHPPIMLCEYIIINEPAKYFL